MTEPDLASGIVIDEGVIVAEKSAIVNITDVEWEREPLVPVTVTVYVPTEPLQDRVDVLDGVILVGLNEQLIPAEGDDEDARETVSEKPPIGLMLTVVEPAVPAVMVSVPGEAEIVKSAMLRVK